MRRKKAEYRNPDWNDTTKTIVNGAVDVTKIAVLGSVAAGAFGMIGSMFRR